MTHYLDWSHAAAGRLTAEVLLRPRAQAAGLVSYLSDAVTPEAEVTDLVRRLPLETGVEGWAARILKEKGIVGRDRGKYYDLVKKGYDISAVERYFMKIYQSEGIS